MKKELLEVALPLEVVGTPTDGLLIGRADLAEALRIVAHLMGKRVSGASLTYEDGWLFIAAGRAVAKAPARGFWPLTIVVPSSWVRRLGRSLPPGDPVSLRVENGRIYANSYSEPCQWSIEELPLHPSVNDAPTRASRIFEAATALKPFLVGREDIESLIKEVHARGNPMWREEEAPMIAAVAKAWEFLAPLGVETADLRRIVDMAVRDAWKAKAKQK